MIHDLLTDSGLDSWNILLDENGGPNHVRELLFSPLETQNWRINLHFLIITLVIFLNLLYKVPKELVV
jgi:hypothetical protein